VQMRIEAQIAVCALDDGYGASLAGRQATQGVPPQIPAGHGVREDAHHLSQQLPVEGERETQGERHRDHELSQRHVGQDVLGEVESDRISPHLPFAGGWILEQSQ